MTNPTEPTDEHDFIGFTSRGSADDVERVIKHMLSSSALAEMVCRAGNHEHHKASIDANLKSLTKTFSLNTNEANAAMAGLIIDCSSRLLADLIQGITRLDIDAARRIVDDLTSTSRFTGEFIRMTFAKVGTEEGTA